MLRALAPLGVLSTIILLASAAGATPYWIAWEGNDWPENQGWTRHHGPGADGAERTLAGGQLEIDGVRDPPVYDFLRMQRPGAIDPDPGEVFIMRWRMRVDQVSGAWPWDPGVGVLADARRLAAFLYSGDQVRDPGTPWSATFLPGVFHEYEMRSEDMLNYRFSIDAVQAWQGTFLPSGSGSEVSWGDGSSGVASRTTWDYFEYGVVPESTSWVLLLAMGIAGSTWPRRTLLG